MQAPYSLESYLSFSYFMTYSRFPFQIYPPPPTPRLSISAGSNEKPKSHFCIICFALVEKRSITAVVEHVCQYSLNYSREE